MKKRKNLIILAVIALVGIFGVTLAYFMNSTSVTNEFNTNPYGTTIVEEFVSPTNWLPGDVTNKTLIVENTGEVDEAVRVSYVETWTSKNGATLSGVQNGNKAAIINFTNVDDYIVATENGVEYRYYKYRLAPNESTTSLLSSVTFNPLINNDNICNTVTDGNVRKIICSSTGDGYDDATYTLSFTIETVQYDKYKEAWGTNINLYDEKVVDNSVYSNNAISGLRVGSVINPSSYQTGYSEEDANNVHMKYEVDENYTVTAVDVCKKETSNAPGICVVENDYNNNLNRVLSYFGGDINNMPSECSIEDNEGTEELTCANNYVVIGVDAYGGLFVNDIESGKSCVVNSMVGIYSCK